MNIAIIPARGGSKRIPRKNVKSFCGKPMIAWSIIAAIESKCFDHVVVSTDDEEIASVAQSYGAEVPFLRPTELADDYTVTRDVLNHAILTLEPQYGKIEYVCCIYATAPFVKSADLQRAYSRLVEEDCDFVFSVTTFPFPIQRAIKVTGAGRVEMFFPENRFSRSQDLEEAYHDAGQFYWGKTCSFKDNMPTFSDGSIPFILPRLQVQDIDTTEDWATAEKLFLMMISEKECET